MFEGVAAGFIVDGASELLRVSDNEIESVPELFKEIGVNYLKGVINQGGRHIAVVDVDEIFNGEILCELNRVMELVASRGAADRMEALQRRERYGKDHRTRLWAITVSKEGAGQGLSDCEFQSLSELIERECGFYLGVEKRTFLESRLRKRMDELGLKAAQDYYCLLRNDRERERELPTLLDRMMICETSFFRNMAQFELLTEVVLPDLISEKERTGSRLIRLWSAGCSTGQEPYSLVMCLNESISRARGDGRQGVGVRPFIHGAGEG